MNQPIGIPSGWEEITAWHWKLAANSSDAALFTAINLTESNERPGFDGKYRACESHDYRVED